MLVFLLGKILLLEYFRLDFVTTQFGRLFEPKLLETITYIVQLGECKTILRACILVMGPIGFSYFSKIRLVHMFNQGYRSSPNIEIIRYWARVHSSTRTLSFMVYDMGYLGIG